MYLLKKHSCLFCSELGSIQGVKAKIFVYHPRLSLTSSNCVLSHILLRVGLRPNSIDLYKLINQIGKHPSSPLSRQMETLVCGDYKVTAILLQCQSFSHYPEWMTISLPYQEVHCSPNLICHMLTSNLN